MGQLIPGPTSTFKQRRIDLKTITLVLLVFSFVYTQAANFTSTTSGNWSAAATWGGAGVPGTADNVIIGHGTTVAVNGAYICNNLTIGDATTGVTTVNVSTGFSLTVKGLCSINPSNVNNTYTLNAAAGTLSISGTFAWGTGGTNIVQASTGTITFTPAITIANAAQNIKLTGAGIINFKSSFTDNYNKLLPAANCTINFAGNYTVNTTAAVWAAGTAVFSGTGTITANSALSIFNLTTAASASTTLASAAGAFAIGGALTISSGSTFTANEDFEADGNVTNSGTYAGGTHLITFNGTTVLSGISSLPTLQIGNNNSVNAVSLTLNNNFTCTGVNFNGSTKARTLTISNGVTLTVNGNMIINQPTIAKTNNLAVNGGTCTINGDLDIIGTATGTSFTSKVTVTTGTLYVGGTFNLDANTIPGNQVITLTSNGVITFNHSFNMAYGTLSSTSTGTLNFNGSAPSFAFGGSSAPILTTTNGCTVNIAHGFINNSNVLTFATTSNCYFNNNGAITANAPITFGNVQFLGLDTLVSTGSYVEVAGTCTFATGSSFDALQSIDITGNWISLNTGSSYIQDGGTMTVYGDFIDSGAFTITPNGALSLVGVGANIGGTGSITDSSGSLNIINDKTIMTGTALTFGTAYIPTDINVATASTISSSGSIMVYGNILAADPSSAWLNNVHSSLTISGELLDGGTLDASTVPNTVTYNGYGDQSVHQPITSYYDLIFANSGTKTMTGSAQADDAVSLSGSVVVDEGPYILDGLASLTMTDTTVLKMQRSVTGLYPELGGIYTLPSGTVIIEEDGEPAYITGADYYNLTLTGSQPFDMSAVDYVANDLRLEEAGYIDNSSTLLVGHYFTDSSTAYSTIHGDLSVWGIRLEAGTLDDGGNTITVFGEGSWSNSNGSLAATGTTVFYSDLETGLLQPIMGSTSTTFNNLQINNPLDNVSVSLDPPGPTIVTGVLNMTVGNLATDATNILRMTNTSSTINASDVSYVNGPVVKAGNTDFVFPTGKGGRYGPAGIVGMSNTATEVTTEYFNEAYSDLTPLDTSLNQVSNREYWMMERGVTDDSVLIQLLWTNASFSNIINCQYLTIAHYTNGQWEKVPANVTDTSVCNTNGTGSVVAHKYLNSFSPFTFGGFGGGMALPVTLISFNATSAENVVLTKWQTAMEINNAYFTVERSADGSDFSAIGKVTGAGNSAVSNAYNFTDNNPLKGVSYYRLRQTDFNGNSTVSDIVPVSLNGSNSVAVYPNPAKDNVFITVTNPSGNVKVNIYNMLGERILSKSYDATNTPTQLISIPTIGNLPTGLYSVSVNNNGTETNEKLIIE